MVLIRKSEMSMNLHVDARQLAVLKSGKEIDVIKKFDLYQTPTNVTEEAIMGDSLEVYCDWVIKRWCKSKSSVEHLEKLKDWIALMEEEGFTITFFGL